MEGHGSFAIDLEVWMGKKTYTFDHDSRPIEKNIYREIYLYICAAINTEKGESDVSASNP